jgi:heme-degrading monooxygenase HmoA
MFAVIFEVSPKPEQWDTYLGYARALRPELERIDGFLDNERFSSMRRPGWLLSLSTWRDEKAVIRWRIFARHHEIQERGRSEVFRDYHLRVGEIIADNRLPDGQSLRGQRFDETEAAAKLVTLSEATPEGLPPAPDALTVAARLGAPRQAAFPGLVDWDVFESILQPGKFILLASWRDATAAEAASAPSGGEIRHRRVRVIRDYGMVDRAEAPQYYPPVVQEPRVL